VALLSLTLGLVASGRMHFSFFPPVEADYVTAKLTMPQGTPVDVTEAAVRHLQSAVARTREELDPQYAPEGESLVRHVLASVGTQPMGAGGDHNPGSFTSAPNGSHLGEVVLELVPSEEREISTRGVAQRWRELTGAIPDAVELIYSSDLFSAGDAIDVQLQGPDVLVLRSAAEALKQELARYPGVLDIADSFRAGKREVKLSILPEAETLGVTAQDLARQVRQAFYGEEAQRIQRGRDDLRVMVRYPAEERRSLGDLENMRIRIPDGTEVPFATVARAELGRGYASIRRADRMRVVNVTADLERTVMTAEEVLQNLTGTGLAQILADHPGVSYSLEGQQAEQNQAFGGLARAYVVALLVIFALLAVPLRSYLQPLIIMSVIPFGVVGAVIGHLIMGRTFSFMSVIGIVALSGVVVNASLVLVDYINRRCTEGMTFREAIERAGVARFRPIVLTAITTFLGLTPLMLESSLQAQFLIPMAISLAYGVLFSAFITLLIVPCAYLVIEDLRTLGRTLRARILKTRPGWQPRWRKAA
jgi:multidrug efflux pump subunit AcrB